MQNSRQVDLVWILFGNHPASEYHRLAGGRPSISISRCALARSAAHASPKDLEFGDGVVVEAKVNKDDISSLGANV
jgi:hypothetical protein